VVTNADGSPVANAELAVVVVDEAILALTHYQLADPLSVFYAPRSSYMTSLYGRAGIILANPAALADQLQQAAQQKMVEVTRVVAEMVMEEAMPMATVTAMDSAAGNEQNTGEPIRVRTNFDPLATFAPAVTTDDQGRAQVAIKLPDNLTRYRIMVVAVADGKLKMTFNF